MLVSLPGMTGKTIRKMIDITDTKVKIDQD